jgi:uncharacterized protein
LSADFEAFYLDAAPGHRFCLFHRARRARGAVLFVHAFAEEMNKSRRMVARQARALAQAGFEVLQIDLLGCGDSSGDFADATWRAWLDDVTLAWRWLAARSAAPFWLWGQRTGCLLACEVARAAALPARLILWQPVLAGRPYLNQFLRMKLLSRAGRDAMPRLDTRALRTALAAGQAVEIAGYTLSPALYDGLEQAALGTLPHGSRACWLDVVHEDGAPPSPSSLQQVEAWTRQGVDVSHRAEAGLPFWQTQEITECEPLIASTLRAVCR